MEKNQLKLVYDTLLSAPGMNENVRIDLKVSRRTVLLLSQVIERGLRAKGDGLLPDLVPPEDLDTVRGLSGSCLEKAGLTETSGYLKAFGNS